MSIRAMTWVWENSRAKGSKLLLLLAIADHADDYGRARRSAPRLAKKTRLCTRTIQRLIDELEATGHLRVEEGGGRDSSTYTLIMDPNQGAAGPDEVPDTPDQPSSTGTPDSAQKHQNEAGVSTTGDNLTGRQNDTGDIAVSPQGRHSCVTPGVTQLCHPIPPIHVLSTSTSGEPDRSADVDIRAGGGGGTQQRPTPRATGGGGELADEVLAALGPAWPLGKASRRRLQAPLQQALAAGWSPQALATHLGANPDGVRNRYAVLSARLADLPEPPAKPRPWPAWCGFCDPDTRLIECKDDRAAHCPNCHPKTRKP